MKPLTIHKGTTTDTQGCDFHYTCYTSNEYGYDEHGNWVILQDKIYICDYWPDVRAKTLKELKVLVGRKQ